MKFKKEYLGAKIVLGVSFAKENKFKKRVLLYSELTKTQIVKLINLGVISKDRILDEPAQQQVLEEK